MKRPFLIPLLIIIFLSISTFYASADTATVSWQPNNEKDLAGYRVYYGTASRSYGTPEAVAKTTTCCSFDGLAKGTTYYFAVTAVDASGNESGYSAEVSKFIAETQPGAPPISVNLAASLPSPQTAGKKVTFTANASGKGDYEYKFYCANRPVQGYSPSNTFVWDTAGLRGTKRIVVHVRSKGANVRYQKYAYVKYRVTTDTSTDPLISSPPTDVQLHASLPSPQTAGKKVTFTANASGKGDYEYKFYCNNRPVQDYSPSNTFVWDTVGLRGTKRIVVHVRSKGTNARYQKYAYIRYRVTADSSIAASGASGASSPISTVEKRNRLIMLYQKYFKHFSWNVTPKS